MGRHNSYLIVRLCNGMATARTCSEKIVPINLHNFTEAKGGNLKISNKEGAIVRTMSS